MKIFYDHLVNIHELHLEFDKLEIPVEDRNEMIGSIDSAVHHEVFDLIMVTIPEEHRTIFLESFSNDPGDETILVFLKARVPDIEDQIKARADEVKGSFIDELRSKL